MIQRLLIQRLLIQPYALPLRRVWGSARGDFAQRRGWLIQVSAAGWHGYGDCAPLPIAGTETHEVAWNALCQVRSTTIGHLETWFEKLEPLLTDAPATRFSLECAWLDLLSRRQGISLRHWLAVSAQDAVPVNAMLGSLAAITPAVLKTACDAGFRVLKIKVGIEEPATEIRRLTALARQLPPNIGLRLDANGAWEPDVAKCLIDRLAKLPVESLEEPLRIADPVTLAALQARAAFPLARDESLHGFDQRCDLFCQDADIAPAALGVRRIVLKPAVIGGLQRTLSVAARARTAGLEVVITSLVDSAAGLWPTAQLAAAIGGTLPHGLATADWLITDLGCAPMPRRGWIDLPRTAGSGFSPS